MSGAAVLKLFGHGLLGLVMSAQAVYAAAISPLIAPPGTYHTSWIGNSFGGGGASALNPNQSGYWVQDNAGSMAVSDDGTVFLGTIWDEAGRTVGLYKNGQPNINLVKATSSPIKAWGFNTANTGLCVDGSFFYLASQSGALLRFQWTPGDINSTHYVGETRSAGSAVSLSCKSGKILLSYRDRIEVRDETNLRLISTIPAENLVFALRASDGSFWIISGKEVRHLDPQGIDKTAPLGGIGDPTSLAWGPHGQLIVTDNGSAQRILFFDIAGTPRLVSTFGIKGGLYAGTPGAVAPLKLFALKGAGIDATGNLYVAMSFANTPAGNTFLRAFSPTGKLLWQVYAAAFVDTFGFEPGSGGTIVYGRTTRWQLNLDNKIPGSEATLDAVTLDPLQYPDDPRIKKGLSIFPRVIRGKQLLYATGQQAGGFLIFGGAPGSEILHQISETPIKKGWAWGVTDDGDIWNGDAPGHRIALYPLSSMSSGGIPIYNWSKPTTWPWPADFKTVTRVIYNKNTDSLYLFGYLQGQPSDSWGVLGFTARRYDEWMAGKPTVKWTNSSLPVTANGMGFGKPLSPKEAALSGDYLFLGMVKSSFNQVEVNILNANNGKFVGTLVSGSAVGNVGGNEDIIGSVQATQSAEGEYLILVEDDSKAKNLLFRWKP